MSVTPRYNIPAGSEVSLHGRPMVATGQDEHGHTFVGCEDGATTVVSYTKFAEYLRCPGASIDTSLPVTGGRVKERLGGFATSMAFTEQQLKIGRFCYALCVGTRAYRTELRIEKGDPDLKLSQRMADRREARRFIAKVAEPLFGEPILLEHKRGGRAKGMVIYKGRTLVKNLEVYENLDPHESPIDALIPRDHLKGNQMPRICFLVRELMTEAWEKHGLDLRGPLVSNVLKYLETSIREVNKKRAQNDLPELIIPSHKTLTKHRDDLLGPTELMVATKGLREARNQRGRGSTDYQALMIGEQVQVDECKISLVISAKSAGVWERLSKGEKDALKRLDEYIRSRLWILVMLDVATRMPLAWVIAENPNAEATLALFRMATRNKDREKHLYGCSGQPASAVGLMHVKNDNGTGLRNSTTVGALMGIGSVNSVTRAYSPTDRSIGERFFGTTEIDIFRVLPGYTGGRPGQLPGYDAVANGVLTVEQLHEMLTKYFIDEYPSIRHYGVGMHGRRPAEVYASVNATRGQVAPIDRHDRRIRLGWEEAVTPTDEGVRVFRGIWFNSDEFQILREPVVGKVKVFIDPDDLNGATVVLPGVKDPVEVQLQITAFADMTLPEVLRLMAEYRREDPDSREIFEDRIMRTRRQRYDQIKAIGVEHNLPRSYSTVAECREMAKAVFAGARAIRSQPLAGTTRPGEITNIQPGDGVFFVGVDDSSASTTGDPDYASDDAGSGYGGTSDIVSTEGESKRTNKPVKPRKSKENTPETLLRPQNLKGLN